MNNSSIEITNLDRAKELFEYEMTSVLLCAKKEAAKTSGKSYSERLDEKIQISNIQVKEIESINAPELNVSAPAVSTVKKDQKSIFVPANITIDKKVNLKPLTIPELSNKYSNKFNIKKYSSQKPFLIPEIKSVNNSTQIKSKNLKFSYLNLKNNTVNKPDITKLELNKYNNFKPLKLTNAISSMKNEGVFTNINKNILCNFSTLAIPEITHTNYSNVLGEKTKNSQFKSPNFDVSALSIKKSDESLLTMNSFSIPSYEFKPIASESLYVKPKLSVEIEKKSHFKQFEIPAIKETKIAEPNSIKAPKMSQALLQEIHINKPAKKIIEWPETPLFEMTLDDMLKSVLG